MCAFLYQFQLILLVDTAIGIGLRHASLKALTMKSFGRRLSNAWSTYLSDKLNLGN
jgi:hypothetical protein